MAYKSAGSTTHYSIFYDTLLSKTDGEDRANDLKAVCELDFALMAGWFPGVEIKYSTPFEVRIEQGGGNSASWGADAKGTLFPISLFPNNGQALDRVRYLLVAEVTEMFMQSQKKGWYGVGSEGSIGEGLSLFLSRQFLSSIGSSLNPGGIADLWLNGSRTDWVNKTDQGDRFANEKSGCAVLFLWYLNVQLGFDINSIVAAADPINPNLSKVYKNLTGDMVDPFLDFQQILESAFPANNPDGTPRKSTIPGSNPDNPFPLPSPRSLSVKRYIASLPPDQHTDRVRILIERGGKHTLRPTLNTNRHAAIL